MGLTYVELPDLSLSALQERFTIPSELEQLYKRYEQRFQIGEMLLNYSNTKGLFLISIAYETRCKKSLLPKNYPSSPTSFPKVKPTHVDFHISLLY